MIDAVIVNYRLARQAVRAARSLLAQDVDEELGVWVVDNSELHEDATFLKDRLGSRCHVIINPKNVGFGAACNQVFEQTSGKWFLLLNPDAYLDSRDTLKSLVKFLEERPYVGAASPFMHWDEGRHFMLPPNVYPIPAYDLMVVASGLLSHVVEWLGGIWWRKHSLKVWQSDLPVEQENLSGGHLFLRRSAVESVGGLFDPRFFLYYEDTDLCLRLRQAGYRLFVVPGAMVVHEFSGCARYEAAQWKQRMMDESRRLFMERHYKRNILYRLLKRLGKRGPRAWQPLLIEDLGTFRQPPVFKVPSRWQGGWLLEWSPSPYMFPSAGMFGEGKEASVPESVFSILPPGKQYVRIGPRRGLWAGRRVWQWEARP